MLVKFPTFSSSKDDFPMLPHIITHIIALDRTDFLYLSLWWRSCPSLLEKELHCGGMGGRCNPQWTTIYPVSSSLSQMCPECSQWQSWPSWSLLLPQQTTDLLKIRFSSSALSRLSEGCLSFTLNPVLPPSSRGPCSPSPLPSGCVESSLAPPRHQTWKLASPCWEAFQLTVKGLFLGDVLTKFLQLTRTLLKNKPPQK